MPEKTVVATNGTFRAVIVREEHSEAPDGDFQAAVMRLDYNGFYDVDGKTEAAGDFEHQATHFLSTFGMHKGIEVFKRYLSIFHGTNDVREFSYSYSPDSAVYLAFDSADMRKSWGCADDRQDGAEGTAYEWQAYIDGDVYGIAVERNVTFKKVWEDGTEEDGAEWVTVDDSECWGFYGETYAIESAVGLLNDYADKD